MRRIILSLTVISLLFVLAGCKTASTSLVDPSPELSHVETATAFFNAALQARADSLKLAYEEAKRIGGLFYHTPPDIEEMMVKGLANMIADFNKLRDKQADWDLDKAEEIERDGETAKVIVGLAYTDTNDEGVTSDGVRYLTLTMVRLAEGWRIALIQ